MKKVLSVVVLSLLVGSAAVQAATVKDNCGCGLGSMMLGDKPDTLLVQLVATFLNGSFGSQTFGITSGTSGCNQNSGFAVRKEMIEYVGANMDHLAMDVAMGSGDSLEAIADLMEVSPAARTDLFAKLQSGFGSIFADESVSAEQVVDSITEIANS